MIHCATLHKPHVATHSERAFLRANVEAVQALLAASLAERVQAFVLTSTTSAFGAALRPAPGAPAAWITEEVRAVPRNVYGVTKGMAEDLAHLYA
ncbi:NAD(P)-dependent oxidoreductase, partial [Rhodosalinus halophilus]